MAFSLSGLLNPEPESEKKISEGMEDGEQQAEPSVEPAPVPPLDAEQAPSLQDAKVSQDDLASLVMDAKAALEVTDQDPSIAEPHDAGSENVIKTEPSNTATNAFDLVPPTSSEYAAPQVDIPVESFHVPASLPQQSSQDGQSRTSSPVLSTKPGFVDPKNRSSKHSSKNEGQHTDRRYLCYICNKLFTRRRSVRDHISKIHNTKTWEPVRSLEIIVEPITGEPLEPLEDIIARGPPLPASKPERKPKTEKRARSESISKPQDDQEEADEPVPQEPIKEPTPAPPIIPQLKTESSVDGSRNSSLEPSTTPAPVIGKKRPAPSDTPKSTSAAATKKGTAKIKSSATPNKRPKLNDTSTITNGTPSFRSPTGASTSMHRTPASKLKNQAYAASAASSPAPSSRAESVDRASPSPSATDSSGSSNDDGEIFCICRKGDNHTWMIACDGGCDEWFHGNCVNIRERDGELIDKYICPNCKRDGYQTTWKRMCRRKGCRKPAKVFQDPPSKYCSKDCGRMFFIELIRRGDPWIDTIKNGQYVVEGGKTKKMRKKRRTGHMEKILKSIPLTNGDVGELVNEESRLATPAYSEDEKTEYETDSSADEDMLPNRGGALRAGEVKALLEKCRSIEQWRNLGQKPATPPRDLDGEEEERKIEYDDFEKEKLESLEQGTMSLTTRNDLLAAREKLLDLVKNRSAEITEEIKKSNSKLKDVCGFDFRLTWAEEEFVQWYNSQGKTLLDSGKIGAPDNADDQKMTNGVDESEDEDDSSQIKDGVCVRNRCPRHRNWAKGQLAEIRFEQDVTRKEMEKLEEQKREIKDRAIVRWWETRV